MSDDTLKDDLGPTPKTAEEMAQVVAKLQGRTLQASPLPVDRGTAKTITARQREEKALALRQAHLSYRAIGKALGISGKGAWGCVDRALQRLNAEVMEDAAKYRALELQRLDAIAEPLYAKSIHGDEQATAILLKVMDRRARLLGLDAPTKIEARAQIENPLAGLPVEELKRIAEGAKSHTETTA